MALPKQIYVKEMKDSDGSTYLDANRTVFGVAEDEAIIVGIYQLTGKKKVQKLVSVKDVMPR
jgi:hypothetical protein